MKRLKIRKTSLGWWYQDVAERVPKIWILGSHHKEEIFRQGVKIPKTSPLSDLLKLKTNFWTNVPHYSDKWTKSWNWRKKNEKHTVNIWKFSKKKYNRRSFSLKCLFKNRPLWKSKYLMISTNLTNKKTHFPCKVPYRAALFRKDCKKLTPHSFKILLHKTQSTPKSNRCLFLECSAFRRNLCRILEMYSQSNLFVNLISLTTKRSRLTLIQIHHAQMRSWILNRALLLTKVKKFP